MMQEFRGLISVCANKLKAEWKDFNAEQNDESKILHIYFYLQIQDNI